MKSRFASPLPRLLFPALLALAFVAKPITAQDVPPSAASFYNALKRFDLTAAAEVNDVVLKRDRAEMRFSSGKMMFAAPAEGRIYGAVFIGKGTFRAEVPANEFEKDNVRRLLKADVVESDFTSAVLWFSDDTLNALGPLKLETNPADAAAQKLAREFEPRLLKETGVNISARTVVSVLNQEKPGIFAAQFDGGKRDRFTLVLDPQGRIPTEHFAINSGEKGILFSHRSGRSGGNDIWMAFFSLEDYTKGIAQYSDAFDLVETARYQLQIDVRDPKKALRVQAQLDLTATIDGLRAIPFDLTESLDEFDSERLKRAMRVKGARLSDGTALTALQEDWEGGLTVILPQPRAKGENFSIVIDVEGDYLFDPEQTDCFYPLNNSEWYPRHGYLNRSAFDLTFRHNKRHRVAGPGVRVKEQTEGNDMITEWRMESPVSNVTFALGKFERYQVRAKGPAGDVPIEFHSISNQVIKEDFIMAEMMNALNYFSTLFGAYPYPRLDGAFHPRGFGQGFASLLLLPAADSADKYTYSFIAHETAHQWWGNVVGWRSYRDQWLSEGFAEYSGMLYTGVRDKRKAQRELIEEARRSLIDPPVTQTGILPGKLSDVGPLILGHRLSTRETLNAYQSLIYEKGALVLRMLHFLFTDPATGEGKPFFDMMTDFVQQHRNGWATSDSFMQVANEHFKKTPLSQRFRIENLDWFFSQWVYQAHLPSYRLEYRIQDQADGAALITGTVYQDNVPDSWGAILPVTMHFGKDQIGRTAVAVRGHQSPVNLRLPRRPSEVELDPDLWILSEKTTTRELR